MESDGKILVNLTRASVVCEHVEIADRPRRRMRGLLGRDSLEPGDGMLLQPAPSIHTAFMRFAIDVAFLDGTLRVMKIVPGLRPWRMAAAHHAWGVVELAAGEVERRGVAIGDQFGVVNVKDKVGVLVAGPGGIEDLLEPANGRPGGEPDAASESLDGWREADGRASDGKTRVLLVGADRRFRSVAGVLLTRRGCSVALGDHTASLSEQVSREAPEVVVLDAGISLTEAARGAAQIEALDPPVGVVVVGEESELGLSTMPVLPKWSSFDGLYEAIERARMARARRATSARRA